MAPRNKIKLENQRLIDLLPARSVLSKRRIGNRTLPPADPDVVRLAEIILAAAKRGQIRALAVGMVNPLHDFEIGVKGAHTMTQRAVLIGALAQLVYDLLESSSK